VGLRHTYRVAALSILGLVVGLSAVGCASPSYNYVADYSDNAYFKVPPSWHQVNESTLESAEGPSNSDGTFLWSRAFDASSQPSVEHIFAPTAVPVAYASVMSMSTSERADFSFNTMRDLILPVTSAARQAAAAQNEPITGFQSISDQVISNGNGYRGIREIFDYTLGGVAETFDLTVMTDSATTKLYFLLVQCTASCFVSNYSQINTVVGSFTVGGGS
jgi:hypothetical protein